MKNVTQCRMVKKDENIYIEKFIIFKENRLTKNKQSTTIEI